MIEQRLARAKEEAEGIDDYDCLIVNDDLESCVDELHSVIQNEKKKSRKERGVHLENQKRIK